MHGREPGFSEWESILPGRAPVLWSDAAVPRTGERAEPPAYHACAAAARPPARQRAHAIRCLRFGVSMRTRGFARALPPGERAGRAWCRRIRGGGGRDGLLCASRAARVRGEKIRGHASGSTSRVRRPLQCFSVAAFPLFAFGCANDPALSRANPWPFQCGPAAALTAADSLAQRRSFPLALCADSGPPRPRAKMLGVSRVGHSNSLAAGWHAT